MEYWSSGVMSKTKTAGPLLITRLYLIIGLLLPTVGVRAAVLEKLTIGWSAIAGSQAPFWITKEAGLFEKNGLDVTMIYVDGGSKATQALMSGDVPIAQVGGNAPVVARLRGADVHLLPACSTFSLTA
jgi:ABC-type nitrate/sulfonate/bicarbonate transport system substrate-binding protein